MSLVRNAVEKNQLRSFGFRAFHQGLQKLVNVHELNFENLDREASVSLPGSPLVFRAVMRDLVLLEDTSRKDKNDLPIYEGDRVKAKVQNEFGSWEMLEGTVLFDDNKWGFAISFEQGSRLGLSGAVDEVEIIGNMFEYGGKRIQGTKKETGVNDGKTILPGSS